MKQILTGIVLSSITLVSMTTITADASIQEWHQREVAEFLRKRDCLAENIYHEARSESQVGKRAVAYVTLNRVNHEAYPDDVCDVVYQAKLDSNGVPLKHKCQFSWYCDGRPDRIEDREQWNEALYVASVVLNTYGTSFDPTEGAIMYHANYVNPSWRKAFERTTSIDNHVFYREEK